MTFLNTERYKAAARIARTYPVSSMFVYELLEFFEDDDYHVTLYLDLYSPLGYIPSAAALRYSFGVKP